MHYSMVENGRVELEHKFKHYQQSITLSTIQRTQINNHFDAIRRNFLMPLPYVVEANLAGGFVQGYMNQTDDIVTVTLVVSGLYLDLTPQSVINRLHRDLTTHFALTYICPMTGAVMIKFGRCMFELQVIVELENYVYVVTDGGKRWDELTKQDIDKLTLPVSNEQMLMLQLISAWQVKHQLQLPLSVAQRLKLIDITATTETLRDGLIALLKYFDWQDSHCSYFQLQRMDNYQFAHYCRDYLFGDSFIA